MKFSRVTYTNTYKINSFKNILAELGNFKNSSFEVFNVSTGIKKVID